MSILDDLGAALQQGDADRVCAFLEQALLEELPPEGILREGLLAGMALVGDDFREHRVFLPDVLLAAKAMHAGLELLRPHLAGVAVPTGGRVVLGTVRGDLHDIGKNLVGIMLQGAGLEVIDLGHDVAPERFVETALERQAPVIGMSALLTTTMPAMQEVVQLLEARKLRGQIRTIVGGAPLSQEFADEIGADAYGYDAVTAVVRIKALLDG